MSQIIVLFAGTGFFKNMIGAEIQSARSQLLYCIFGLLSANPECTLAELQQEMQDLHC